MPRRPTETVQVNLRMKESLRRQLEDAAKANEVSLNAEMIRRLEQFSEHEELRRQVEHRDLWLDALVRKQAREAPVIAGWISDEMRKRGLDEKDTKELATAIKLYLGGRNEDQLLASAPKIKRDKEGNK
jgi:Arc-like DNA binding domain